MANTSVVQLIVKDLEKTLTTAKSITETDLKSEESDFYLEQKGKERLKNDHLHLHWLSTEPDIAKVRSLTFTLKNNVQ